MSEHHERVLYPFSAIVGQERMKTALMLNAINPGIGGVLIKGDRGTAKSTSVRSLASLLPVQDVVVGCEFSCDPTHPEEMCKKCRENPALQAAKQRMRVVELPISATEDKALAAALPQAGDAALGIMDKGVPEAANRFNGFRP